MRPLIVANWKMNPTSLAQARGLFQNIGKKLAGVSRAEVVIMPPFPYLGVLAAHPTKRFKLGAQDVFWQNQGAFTGEVSPAMLKDLGVQYVLVGHSERRRFFGETNEMVNRKVRAALHAGMRPIIAIGEPSRESREVVPETLAEELFSAFAAIPKQKIRALIIAYEPMWAIGTGNSETPDNATRRAIYIRKLITKIAGRTVAEAVRILYGGSVNAKNAASFISRDFRGMDGLLVGGASLEAREFTAIVRAVDKLAR